ncbi:MAG: LytTR family transcriptional regulator DNA-binding domain-containing protein [Bacteroidota bacterium]|nr:LytTR family transcriptional regulator DNA-binding domain-containing protein [Bacteroidota bacterium]
MKSYQSQTESKSNAEQLLTNGKESQFFKKETAHLFQNITQLQKSGPVPVSPVPQYSENIFRLFAKHFEYVYARPSDIIMIESCDHLVKVYVGVGERAKLTLRHDTLKGFLSQLPPTSFLRIGRFCAINIQRLTGGNCNEQIFEFDFKISIKLKHSVSHSVFSGIGI